MRIVVKGSTDRALLMAAMKDLSRKEARIGFFAHSKYPDGTPAAYVATIQEFGHGAIPARPFFRPTIAEQKAAWRETLRKGYQGALNGKITVESMLTQFAAMAAGDVKQKIASIQTPPLAISTLLLRKHKKEGGTVTGKKVGEAVREANFNGPRQSPTPDLSGVSTKPLVDTGYLISQVTFAVVSK